MSKPNDGIDCPDCDNDGIKVIDPSRGEIEQCMFCYTTPNSKFNRWQEASDESEKNDALMDRAEKFYRNEFVS